MGLDNTTAISVNFNNVRYSPAHVAFAQQLKSAAQYTILQDTGGTSHSSNDTAIEKNKYNSLTFLADPQTAVVLKASGFKNLALEVRKEFQPLVDKVARGEMTPQQYAQGVADMYRAAGDVAGSTPSTRSVEFGKIVQSMAANGIRVHCVESQAAGLNEHGRYVDTMDIIKGAYSDVGSARMGVSDLSLLALQASKVKISEISGGKVFPTAIQERTRYVEGVAIEVLKRGEDNGVGAAYKQIMEERMKGDVQLAKTIKGRVGNEKTLVYYGAAHGSYGYDLDEALDGAKKIALYSDVGAIKSDMQYGYMQRLQMPDSAISLSDGQSFAKDQLDKMILKDSPQVPLSAMPVLAKPK